VKKKLAIIGTRGLPARYGGFETLVDNLTRFLGNKYQITVYCSKDEDERYDMINNARLIYLPFKANGYQSIIYDMVAILHSVFSSDKILLLGGSGGVILMFLSFAKNKIILNYGGLDHERNKWRLWQQKILSYIKKCAINGSGRIIADNIGIQDYIKKIYGRESVLIEYGGDHVVPVCVDREIIAMYPFIEKEYALTVARIQKDNNIEIIIKAFIGFSKYPVVIVGNWGASKYGIGLRKKYGSYKQVIMLDAIYEQKYINAIRTSCKIYIHGHSAGGTNPALVEAMCLKLPVFCYESIFNVCTTENKAVYFKNANDLLNNLNKYNEDDLNDLSRTCNEIAKVRYSWDVIIKKYEKVID